MTLGVDGFMDNSEAPEPLIVVARDIDDVAGTARLIESPDETLSHAFNHVELMDISYDAKKITFWELAMAIITLALERHMRGRI